MMRLYLFIASVVILGLVVPSGTMAQVNRRDFVGLWQAIDSLDGSTQLLSITCSSKQDCDVRLNDTSFTDACPNQIGFARGEGSIMGRELTVVLTLTCTTPDGPSAPLSQLNMFVFDSSNSTLTNFNDDPGPVANVFHRISK